MCVDINQGFWDHWYNPRDMRSLVNQIRITPKYALIKLQMDYWLPKKLVGLQVSNSVHMY